MTPRRFPFATSSRRTFLAQLTAAAGTPLWWSGPTGRLRMSGLVDPPAEIDAAFLRAQALIAVDAARAAGATFADVRLMFTRSQQVGASYASSGQVTMPRPPSVDPPGRGSGISYGVRAMVDGAWGCASGYELTPEAIAETARIATRVARVNRPRHPRTIELAPVPVVANGEWETPIERDPFLVSLKDVSEVAFAVASEFPRHAEVMNGYASFSWHKTIKVFASTEGSLITQRLMASQVEGWVNARVDGCYGAESIPQLKTGGYGYEAVGDLATLLAAAKTAAEGAVAEARAIRDAIPAEVGRFDIVLGAFGMACQAARTLGTALNLERALGYRANREGTSFAAPPEEIVGAYRIGPPILTVRADRSLAHGTETVGWDDEGVRPETYPLVRDGMVVDYLSNRQTAPVLDAAYRKMGARTGSRGASVSDGDRQPAIAVPNIIVDPGPGAVTLQDLIADTKRGYYIGVGAGKPDQQVLNTQFSTGTEQVREIRNGKLGRYVRHLACQFIAPQFWKQLDALGGPGTVERHLVDVWDIDASSRRPTVEAVPGRIRQLNVLNVGRLA